MADTPGNGSSSPFGNGQGNVSGASGDSHKGMNVRQSYNQPKAPLIGAGMANPDSIPPGGRLPFPAMDPPDSRKEFIGTVAGTAQRKPFKLQGSAPEAAPSAAPSSDSSGTAGEIPASDLEGLSCR